MAAPRSIRWLEPREFLEAPTGVIKSQADQEWSEGSETRAWSPDRTVKPHECAASYMDEEIVRYSGKIRRGWIKSQSITFDGRFHFSVSGEGGLWIYDRIAAVSGGITFRMAGE